MVSPIPSSLEEEVSSTHNGYDLEKQETQQDVLGPSVTRSTTRARVTRTQSLARRNTRGRFTHPLSHVKTTEAEIVDFDGLDDPYRPVNWPFRKKLVTTLLYGLTTMGATWASAVYAPAVDQISKEYHVGQEVCPVSFGFWKIAGFMD